LLPDPGIHRESSDCWHSLSAAPPGQNRESISKKGEAWDKSKRSSLIEGSAI
jgi:hypothetical protein